MNLSGTKKAPPASVVIPHFAFGAVAFFVLTCLMFVFSDDFTGHYFSPHLLAITHVAVLGWIGMVIFGSLYQLLPVILLAELFSNKLARLSFYLFGVGIILLCISFGSFWIGLPLQIASVLLMMAVLLFSVNIFFTAKNSDEITIEAEFIITSAIWLLVTVTIGLLLVFNFTHPFLSAGHLHYLKLHSHIGFAGWFLLLIMGVGSKLLPMFLLSSQVKTKKLKICYYLINAALLGFLMDALIFKSTERALVYFFIAVTGVFIFISFLWGAYKNRARKYLDAGMKHSMLAFLLTGIPIVAGLIIHSSVLDNHPVAIPITIVYVVAILLGFVSFLVMGQTFKTLPFIVWLHRYKSFSGKVKTPLPRDLFSEKVLKWQFILFVIAYPVLQTGIILQLKLLIKLGCLLFIVTSALYLYNVVRILFHRNTNQQLK